MNTALSRLNAVFAWSVSVLATLTFLCFLSTAFLDKSSQPSLTVLPEIVLKNAKDFGTDVKDLAILKFNLLANFSDLFDWNTKQLFILVVAHYRTRNNPRNQVVLWDRIIRRGDSAALDLHTAAAKYNFFDDGQGLKGNKNVTIQVLWNVFPIAGRLPLLGAKGYQMQFPNSYSTHH